MNVVIRWPGTLALTVDDNAPAPGARLGRRALWALCGVLALFGLYHLAMQPALSELAAGAPYINAYGRQRMLSQRLTKAVLASQYDISPAERQRCFEEAVQTLSEWTEQHARLLERDAAYLRSPEMAPAVATLDRHFQTMRSQAARFIELMSSDATADVEELARLSATLLAAEPLFLAQMNEIVGWYEAEVQQRVRELRWVGWGIFALLIATSLFLHAGVVLPAIRVLSSLYQANLSRYRTLVENMSDGLALVDRQGTIQFANQRLRTMLQLTGEPAEWNRLDDYLLPAPGARAALMQTIHLHGRMESRFQRVQDGMPIDVILRCQAIHDVRPDNDAITLVVMTDITAEKSGRERLRDLQDQLSRVQRLKTVGEMSASLAHELGQPLGAISAFVGGCRHQLDTEHWEPERLKEQLRRIERAATRAGEILQRFRAYGRRASLQPLVLDFSALVGEVQELCGPLLAESNTSLHCQIDQTLPAVSGDPLLIQQVLMNLIQNAVQALEGLPQERRVISLTVIGAAGGSGVEITVADRGKGIPSDLLARLTEPFFTTRPNGLGLGLSICRTIIEDHEGRLCVTSEAGAGTTVRLLLPAMIPEAAHV